MVVAIQPDNYGRDDASAPRWARALHAAGHEVRWVDVRRPDIVSQLRGCAGFMWRHGHLPEHRQIARRLLPVVERELGLAVYPDQKTCWHYDDKLAQAVLLEALHIPTPQTSVFFDRDQALEWLSSAQFPLVLKLWSGAGSENVRLIDTRATAVRWIEALFSSGVRSLGDEAPGPWPSRWARIRAAWRLVRRGYPPAPEPAGLPWEVHRNYVLFQEYLPNNAHDTRITVIGNRAFGFRRWNRDQDFRASGSGKIDYEHTQIDPAFIRLAFETTKRLCAQSCAIDGLWRGSEAVVGEVSYTYVSWAVQHCPGHWDRDLVWHPGHIWPEDAQVEDFLVRLGG